MKIPKEINVEHFRVAIFGSARIKKADPRYKQIQGLARMIASEGIDVVTGGGPGIMEAANKGHREGRGKKKIHSFGLNIMLPKEQSANKHLDIKKDFIRFSERLDYFMYLSNVVVVAPGGIGTILELFYTWQLIQVKHICNIPIILLGDMWEPLIEWVKKYPLEKKFMKPEDMGHIFIAKSTKDAMSMIKAANEGFESRGDDYCLNFNKYNVM